MPTFQRVLIANRGEIAVRIIRACRELGLSPVAVYSEADAGAMHVRLADAALPIGPAPAAQSYLQIPALLAAAKAGGAEAIHPGYGFLAENAGFARACAEAGLVFVGPPPAAIEAMGGKIGARRLAMAAGVPVVPGYNGENQDAAKLATEAERIGFPLLIKASAGGGGKGMRIVRQPAEFAAALEGARRESQAAFGDATVFLEKLILQPRHIEIQVLADSHGNVVHLGERECSIQRRHQKIVEEAPSPFVSPELRAEMGAAAVRVARAAGYVNAGTVEFVADAAGNYYFLEMNTRLQVEHPVTELVTGLDLVHLQFKVAMGERLPFSQEDVQLRGQAIEVRLYAEDPQTYLPAIGRLAAFEPPTGPGLRVDAGLAGGDEVTVHYDPMIAKIIVAGPDRLTAIARLQRALADTIVLGLTTNLPLLQAIAAHPAYAAGATHTGFLEQHSLDMDVSDELPSTVAAAAALHDLAGVTVATADPFSRLWRHSGAVVPLRYCYDNQEIAVGMHGGEPAWTMAYREREYALAVLARRPGEIVFMLSDDNPARLVRARLASDAVTGDLLLAWNGRSYRLSRPVALSADSALVATGHHGAESLIAPMPGTLIKVLVSAGQAVAEGQPLLILEAMKMEHTITAPHAGLVGKLPFAEGASVAGGVTLIELEDLED
jgi:3-methylcrotonyl-CoA carboxylase alpha subunit